MRNITIITRFTPNQRLSQNTVNAITIVTFGLGSIVGSEIFQPKDAPAYIPGKIAILVLLSAQVFISLFLRWTNIRLNKKKEVKIAEEKERRGWSDADVQKERERHAFLDLTDRQCVFMCYESDLVFWLILAYRNVFFVYTA